MYPEQHKVDYLLDHYIPRSGPCCGIISSSYEFSVFEFIPKNVKFPVELNTERWNWHQSRTTAKRRNRGSSCRTFCGFRWECSGHHLYYYHNLILVGLIHPWSIQLASETDIAPESWINLTMTWSGKSFSMDIAESDRCVISSYLVFLSSLTGDQGFRSQRHRIQHDECSPGTTKDHRACQGKTTTRCRDCVSNSHLIKVAFWKVFANSASLKLTNGKKFILVGTAVGDELRSPNGKDQLLPQMPLDQRFAKFATHSLRIRRATRRFQWLWCGFQCQPACCGWVHQRPTE